MRFPPGDSPPRRPNRAKTDHLGPVRDDGDNPYHRDPPKEQEEDDHRHTDGHRPVLEGDPDDVVGRMPIEDDELAKLSTPTPSLFGTPADVL